MKTENVDPMNTEQLKTDPMKETEQTLLDQIKDEVAQKNGGWKSWEHISASRYKDELWNVVVDRYATAKAKASCEATLIKASENAKANWLDQTISKSSITDPSNIVIVP